MPLPPNLVRTFLTKFDSARKMKKEAEWLGKFISITISFMFPLPEGLTMFCTSGGIVTGLHSLSHRVRTCRSAVLQGLT